MSRKTAFNVILIYAFVSLVLVVFIPYAGDNIGFIPEIYGWNFSEVVGIVFNSPEELSGNLFVLSYALAFLCSSLLAVFSSARIKSLTVLSSLLGICSSLWTLFSVVGEYGEYSVFDFEGSCLSISFWGCLAINIIVFFSAVFAPRE